MCVQASSGTGCPRRASSCVASQRYSVYQTMIALMTNDKAEALFSCAS